MNAMSFSTYLRNYILNLSDSSRFSLTSLKKESIKNKRLVDPLTLFHAIKNKKVKPYNTDKLIEDLKKSGFDFDKYSDKSYVKIYDSYMNYLNQNKYDCMEKTFLRNKILKLQKEKNISNYRIYTDLKLNPGNTNKFLKDLDVKRLSLSNVKKILAYLQNSK